ncbi:MAG: hypothetical protein CVT75_02125 [Alphaproteobacteria bacterium HGW-Alphaproteobacteria-14]|nr:MAG: hypothetical protein CVT75_02125 [Alphaproteobacteria bacterium HGW-Alphaproteobacteria-14]
MADAVVTDGKLLKQLGFAFAAAVGLGSMIGAGLMRTSGSVVNEVPFAWLVIALWAFGGIHVLLASNVASELVTSIPKAGGIFVPVRAAFGDSMGLLAGWVAYLSYSAAGASLSIVCADFLTVLLPSLAGYTAPVACTFLLIIVGLNWLGVREGGMAQTIGSSVKLILLCAVIGIALFAEPPRPGAFAAVASDNALALGLVAIIIAYQMIYGAYSGWDSAIVFVEEDKNALTNIPRAMALSIGAVTLVYVLFNMSILRALDLEAIRGSDLPIALVLGNVFGPTGAIAVAVLAIILASTSLNANIMGGPRILFGLARDGLFLSMATRVNSGGTPHVAFAITAAMIVLLIFSGSFEFVFRLMGALIIFGFVIYDASLFRLRWTQPDLPRPFRAFGYPALPALVLLIDTGLLIAFIAADPASGLYMAALIALCIPVGILLHRRRRAGN